MGTMTHDTTRRSGMDRESSFALAITVLRERMGTLRREDQDDLHQLLPALLGGDEEERASAERAVNEILNQMPAKVHRMPLPGEPGAALQCWTDFVSRTIREARSAAGLTQQELARNSGLDQSHISRLECGQHSPTNKTLEKIAAVLGLPLAHFDPGP